MSGPATAEGLIDAAVGAGVVPGAVLAAGRWSSEPMLLHVAGHALAADDLRHGL
jgi:hypothetical protein